jgi:hypothetical protein
MRRRQLGNAIGGPWLKTYAGACPRARFARPGERPLPADLLERELRRHQPILSARAEPALGLDPRDSIHNITQKTQNSGASQTTYNYAYAYTYPAPGAVQPHAPTAIGPFTITHDANGNQIRTLTTGTNSVSQYLYDEENRLACANSGQQMPTPSCSGGA